MIKKSRFRISDSDTEFVKSEKYVAPYIERELEEKIKHEHEKAHEKETKKSASVLIENDQIKLSRLSLEEILSTAIEIGATDIFLRDAEKVRFKVGQKIIESTEKLSENTIKKFFQIQLEEIRKQIQLKTKRSLSSRIRIEQADFRYEDASITDALFRVNYYRSTAQDSCVIRVLKKTSITLSELNLLKEFENVLSIEEGLVILSGPTASGKTTTLAAILNELTKRRKGHYLTLEDPIEIFFEKRDNVIVSQREIGLDVSSFEEGLYAAMRQSVDVVLVGEIRTFHALKYAVQLAETGHLVLSTFHATNAIETLIRLMSMIPPDEAFLRTSLVFCLKAILSQRLFRTIDQKLQALCEYFPIREEVRSLIFKEKFQEIRSLFESYGGIPFYRHLQRLNQQMIQFRPSDVELIRRISSVETS